MSRIRTIKPEFWTSEDIVECSTNARLMFIGIWNFCDDNGVHPYSPKSLKMQIFPGDEFTLGDIEKWLVELIKNNLIRTYHIDDKRYFIVTGWHHQKIDRPNPKYPLPDKFDEYSTNEQRTNVDQSPPEGKGREGNIYNPEFEIFYKAYPNKKEKPEAFRRWKKLNGQRPTIEIILEAIRKQIEWRKNAKEGQFRPEWKHPATWLNKGCWNDDVSDSGDVVEEKPWI